MVGALVAALDNPLDLLLLLVVAVLIFGKQLPEVARSLGRGIRELRESADFGEMGEALNSVNEVRSAVSPAGIARAAFPGVSELRDAVVVADDVANPLEPGAGADRPAPGSGTSSAPGGEDAPARSSDTG
jgi:TatA/E family protein of Tat protein translocase